jgi:hypothetical protein
MPLLPISLIRMDGDTQVRADTSQAKVDEYADLMREGVVFQAVTVFFDGSDHWLGGGIHRVGAAIAAGRDEIEADVRPGTRRDAVLFGLGDNKHGLPLSGADKRKAVAILLGDAEWSQWSDREIARHLGVGNSLVSKVRRESFPGTVLRKGADGRLVNTAKIGTVASDPGDLGPLSEAERMTLAEAEAAIDGMAENLYQMGEAAYRVFEKLEPNQFGRWLADHFPGQENAVMGAMEAYRQNEGSPRSALRMSGGIAMDLAMDRPTDPRIGELPIGQLDESLMYATIGNDDGLSAHVYPSTVPKHWYATVYQLGHASGLVSLKKPIREDSLAMALYLAGFHCPDAEWHASACDPASVNPDLELTGS